jgi:MFS family permease
MGLVKNIEGLIACRALLGLFEAGIVPGMSTNTSAAGERRRKKTNGSIKGCVYLIGMYYTRYELQWRMSLFFSASILAGAFSGLLAFAIAKMSDVGGLESWRWYVPISAHRHVR